MNTGTSRSLLLTGMFVLAGSVLASTGQQDKAAYRYPLKQAPANIRVQGSSTLGEWDCHQYAIDGVAQTNISADRLFEEIARLMKGRGAGDARSSGWETLESQVKVAIDANGFDCDNGRMKKDLVEAIRADKYPSINYWFSSVEDVTMEVDADRGPYLKLKVRGELLFGGERRETVHTSYLWLSDDDTIEVRGTLDLEMKAFGIKPPTAFFGMIRADNDFQVGYHIKLETKELVAQELSSLPLYSSARVGN